MRIVCQDVTEFQFPAHPCVAFLFNPFGEVVLRKLMRHIGDEFASRSGQLDLIYANDELAEEFEADAGFTRLWTGLVPLSEEDERADREILEHQPNGEYAWSTEEPSSIYRWIGQSRTKADKSFFPYKAALLEITPSATLRSDRLGRRAWLAATRQRAPQRRG